MGVYQIKYMDKIHNSAVINESVKLAKMRRQFKSTGFINAVLRSIDNNLDNIRIPKEKDDILLHLSIKYSCPEWLVKHFVDSLMVLREGTKDVSVQSLIDDMARYWIKEMHYKIRNRLIDGEN